MPTTPYIVNGTIKNSNSINIANARITFTTASGSVSGVTNSEGKYLLDLADAEYTSGEIVTYSSYDVNLNQTYSGTISGTTLWNVYACDDTGTCDWGDVNFTVTLGQINAINITDNVTGVSGEYVSVFENDNSVVYISSETNFTDISVALSTPSSHNLLFLYWYCNSSNEYAPLNSITDTTNGFKTTGTISFTNPSDRGVCNTMLNGTVFSTTAQNYAYIALQRTINNIVTAPIIDRIDLSGSQTKFYLKSDEIKLSTNTTAKICSVSSEGAIYYNGGDNKHYGCDGTTWNALY